MNRFEELLNARVTLVKSTGETIREDIKAVVDSDKGQIIMFDVDLPLAEGDFLERQLPNETVERFVVEDTGYQEGLKGIPPSFQARVKKVIKRPQPQLQQEVSPSAPKKTTPEAVFVVHGHDEGAKDSVARCLEQFGQKAVVLHEQPDRGRTIIEKFEDHAAEAWFAVVLLTPDDIGGAVGTDPDDLSLRARQNVILELGFFLGQLGRNRVCALHKGNVEIPSDYDGVLFVPMDEHGAWKEKLKRELEAAKSTADAPPVRDEGRNLVADHSDEARTLLIEAASLGGQILRTESLYGFAIEANRKQFGDQDRRSQATWEEALLQLCDLHLIEEQSPGTFLMTAKGYRVADAIRSDSSPKEPTAGTVDDDTQNSGPEQSPEPWRSYVEDEFRGFPWTWQWAISGEVIELLPLCPNDKMELQFELLSGFPTAEHVRAYCERCAFSGKPLKGRPGEILEFVKRAIKSKVRTGEWKARTSE